MSTWHDWYDLAERAVPFVQKVGDKLADNWLRDYDDLIAAHNAAVEEAKTDEHARTS